jgi:hypothetical protein
MRDASQILLIIFLRRNVSLPEGRELNNHTVNLTLRQ